MTKLNSFLTDNAIEASALAKASKRSARTISFLRNGHGQPNLSTMKAIAEGCAKLLGRDIDLSELFDLTVRSKRKAA